MVEKTITLKNEDGLHARAAALFVRSANKFHSEITITAHEESVNGKSIIGIMSLGAKSNEEISLRVHGSDEIEAIDKLISLIENNFIE